MKITFGSFIRDTRTAQKKTLREFCRESGYDVAYISRLENDILTPPDEQEKLEVLATSLGIKKGSDTWEQYLNLADVSKRQIPREIDDKVLNYLPAFFRKASKKDVTKADVEQLISLIKGE